jgi:hypothetical protein
MRRRSGRRREHDLTSEGKEVQRPWSILDESKEGRTAKDIVEAEDEEEGTGREQGGGRGGCTQSRE